MTRHAPLLAILLLAGCGRDAETDALDRELVASNQVDPALTAALEDQIMVDPELVQQANDNSVRPATAPGQAPIPDLGLDREPRPDGSDAPTPEARAAAAGGSWGCYAELDHGHGWANRLPAGVPLPRDAAVLEAAGNDLPGCRTRVASFVSGGSAPQLLAFYERHARAAGYATERAVRAGEPVIAGTRARDDAAFLVTLTPRSNGGHEVSVVANNGR